MAGSVGESMKAGELSVSQEGLLTKNRDDARNLSGLMTSYNYGLPFFRHAVMGALLFTAAFFATPVALQALSEAFNKEGDHTAAV
jgi:hypothetical protein